MLRNMIKFSFSVFIEEMKIKAYVECLSKQASCVHVQQSAKRSNFRKTFCLEWITNMWKSYGDLVDLRRC